MKDKNKIADDIADGIRQVMNNSVYSVSNVEFTERFLYETPSIQIVSTPVIPDEIYFVEYEGIRKLNAHWEGILNKANDYLYETHGRKYQIYINSLETDFYAIYNYIDGNHFISEYTVTFQINNENEIASS